MAPYARGARFEDFNGPNGPDVMIATYDLKLAGINAHYQCCVVIHLEPGLSIAVEEQAGLRIRRWGAEEMQHRYRLHLTGTYMDEHQARMEAKYWGIAAGMGHISAAVGRDYSAAEYMSATLGGRTVGRQAGLSHDQGVDKATAHEVLILGCSQAHLAIAARRHHALAAPSASAIMFCAGDAVPQFKHHL